MSAAKMPEARHSGLLWGPTAVLLSPHSDDIALSLGAFLRGRDFALCVRIVTVFSVSNNTVDNSISDSHVVTSMRKGEDARLGAALGSGVSVSWLDRKDAPLRLHIPDKAVFSCALSHEDLSQVRHIVEEMKAENDRVDLFFAPMGLGRHIDHLVVRNAALELLSDGFAVVFYEDLPYAADSSLAEIAGCASRLGALAGQELEVVAIETGVTIEEKVDLLLCYRSQIDSRTESRVRAHAERCGGNSVVERVWVPRLSLPALLGVLKGSEA